MSVTQLMDEMGGPKTYGWDGPRCCWPTRIAFESRRTPSETKLKHQLKPGCPADFLTTSPSAVASVELPNRPEPSGFVEATRLLTGRTGL